MRASTAAAGDRETLEARDVLVLGVETSRDETAAAVVASGRRLLSSVVASQIETHRSTAEWCRDRLAQARGGRDTRGG